MPRRTMSAFSPSKWASSRMVAVGGVVLAVFTAVTFGTLAWLQFQERLDDFTGSSLIQVQKLAHKIWIHIEFRRIVISLASLKSSQ